MGFAGVAPDGEGEFEADGLRAVFAEGAWGAARVEFVAACGAFEAGWDVALVVLHNERECGGCWCGEVVVVKMQVDVVRQGWQGYHEAMTESRSYLRAAAATLDLQP